jgi:hypothetical protein
VSELRPTAGARFLLERAIEQGASATYRATIFTPDAEYATTLELSDDGSVSGRDPAGAPSDLAHMLARLASLTARGAAKRRADGLAAWPQRILRWRGPGR